MNKKTLFTSLVLGCSAASGIAETFSYSFEGIVTSVGSNFDAFTAVNAPVTGTFSYSSTATEAFADLNGPNSFSYINPLITITLTTGGNLWSVNSFSLDNDSAFGGTGVVFGEPADADFFEISNETSSTNDQFPGLRPDANDGSGGARISLTLQDNSAPSDLINGLDLNQQLMGSPVGEGQINSEIFSPSATEDLFFSITSVQLVPEPTSAILSIFAFSLVGFKRRRP